MSEKQDIARAKARAYLMARIEREKQEKQWHRFKSPLAQWLYKHDIKQVDFARIAHVSESAVSRWCSGDTPDIYSCLAIQVVTNRDVSLIDWINDAQILKLSQVRAYYDEELG